MNENLLTLEPKLLWKNFRELTQIPRPSKHEEAVTRFLLDFGKKHCDEAFIDQAGNVILRKKASSIEMSNRKGVVLQAHCDMVPQKDANKVHNFETDPITTLVSGGFVYADGTTLGADDGIGVAAIMTVMEDNNLKHGPLEALITIDEETGMTGASGLAPNVLNSQIMINLDSEEDNIFYIGCAGGVNVHIEDRIQYVDTPDDFTAYKINVDGLLGGHSGSDIHKNRPNAIKIMFRMLFEAQKFGLKLCSAEGGNMRNAIPRSCCAEVLVETEDTDRLERFAEEFNAKIANEYRDSDPDVKITIEKSDVLPEKYIAVDSSRKIVFLANSIVSGVFAMSADMPGLVETSNNLAILSTNGGKLKIDTLLRSSSDSQLEYLCNIIRCIVDYCGGEISFSGKYPGWKPNTHSEILDTMRNTYINLFGSKPEVTAIHAGLECGLILGKYPEMDMISVGPNLSGVHTPSEKVEIASVQKFMKLLYQVLENVPVKGGLIAN